MLDPDMDVVLTMKHVKDSIKHQTEIICRHVYGHQDAKQSPHTPSTDDDDKDSDLRDTPWIIDKDDFKENTLCQTSQMVEPQTKRLAYDQSGASGPGRATARQPSILAARLRAMNESLRRASLFCV